MAKLNYLTALPDGWDGHGSRAITTTAAEIYGEFFRSLKSLAFADVEPMATFDGGLRMEWEREQHSFIAEIRGSGGMYLCSLGPDNGDERDLESDAVDIGALVRFYEDGVID